MARLRFASGTDAQDGADFNHEDERRLQQLANIAAVGLDALRKLCALRLSEAAPAAPLDVVASYAAIEPA